MIRKLPDTESDSESGAAAWNVTVVRPTKPLTVAVTVAVPGSRGLTSSTRATLSLPARTSVLTTLPTVENDPAVVLKLTSCWLGIRSGLSWTMTAVVVAPSAGAVCWAMFTRRMSAAAARSNVTWAFATASTVPPLRTSAVTVAVPGSVPARSVARAWPSAPAGTRISRGVAAGAPTKAPSVVVKVTSRNSGFVRGSSWATSVTIE